MKISPSLRLIIPVSVLLFIACQKDVSEPPIDPIPQCRIETGYYYGGGGMLFDSAVFTYSADSKLMKVESEFESVHYSYTGDKITLRKFYDRATNDLLSIDTIYYTGDNISRIGTVDYNSMWILDTLFTNITFSWQNGRLNKVSYVEYNSYFIDSIITAVYTNAAGNIEKLSFLDEFGEAYDSILYQYDAVPNYFRRANPHFLLIDPFFQLWAGFEPHLAMFYSTNNVTRFTIYGTDDYQITYDLDSTNNISGIKMDGEDYVKYKYSCK